MATRSTLLAQKFQIAEQVFLREKHLTSQSALVMQESEETRAKGNRRNNQLSISAILVPSARDFVSGYDFIEFI